MAATPPVPEDPFETPNDLAAGPLAPPEDVSDVGSIFTWSLVAIAAVCFALGSLLLCRQCVLRAQHPPTKAEHLSMMLFAGEKKESQDEAEWPMTVTATAIDDQDDDRAALHS